VGVVRTYLACVPSCDNVVDLPDEERRHVDREGVHREEAACAYDAEDRALPLEALALASYDVVGVDEAAGDDDDCGNHKEVVADST